MSAFAVRRLFVVALNRRRVAERFFVDQRRHHKTDGIIFTPERIGYRCDAATRCARARRRDEPARRPTALLPILKWKYPDLLSVDLKMRYHRGMQKWMLCATGANGDDVDCRDLDLPPVRACVRVRRLVLLFFDARRVDRPTTTACRRTCDACRRPTTTAATSSS